MLYACYIEIVLQCVFDLLNSLTKGLCRLCWEKNGQVKIILIRQNRFTPVFNFISHSEYSDGCFLSVCIMAHTLNCKYCFVNFQFLYVPLENEIQIYDRNSWSTTGSIQDSQFSGVRV